MNNPSELKNAQTAPVTAVQLNQTFDEISKTLLSSSSELSEQGLAFIKKYPLHSTLIAGGIGFLVGSFMNRK
jgi:ElaB/YqjD/DUF883 family membrane-anchored ribosome-binding protein